MTQEIETYIGKYPEEIVGLFMRIREAIFSIEDINIEEKMWAKLPSYYYGDRFVRIIPFKNHINVEADGLSRYTSEFEGFKFTPKGMLQIKNNQEISIDLLKAAFLDTYLN